MFSPYSDIAWYLQFFPSDFLVNSGTIIYEHNSKNKTKQTKKQQKITADVNKEKCNLITKVTEHYFNCLGENNTYVTDKNLSIKCKNVLHQKTTWTKTEKQTIHRTKG